MGPIPARTHHRVSILDRLLHHATVVITDGAVLPHERRPTPKGGHPTTNLEQPHEGGDFYLATSGDLRLGHWMA